MFAGLYEISVYGLKNILIGRKKTKPNATWAGKRPCPKL
jgi:hypothetical protein